MTIDEAIKHCEEKAEEQEYVSQIIVELHHEESEREHKAACDACASDHRQLAEWLKQLVRAKSMMLDTSHTLGVMCDKVSREIGCKECVYYEDTNICRVREWIKRLQFFSKSIKG